MKIKTQIDKIDNLIMAIDDLDGVPVSYPIIKKRIIPLREYLDMQREYLKAELNNPKRK